MKVATEFELIESFARAFRPARPPRGPGDDCAVLPAARGALCVTTDAVVEGVHFTRPAFSAEDVGHKALAVNLSDLAAMGARPAWFVCAMALPRRGAGPLVRGVARGMAALARAHRIELAGGNFASAPELSIAITAAGEVPRGGALLRSGARPGDLLFVSGTLGDARLGLEKLRAGGAPLRETSRQRRPAPRVALGLLSRRFASAAIDVSDGLSQDLAHLCEASGVGACVDAARLPLGRAVRAAFPDALAAARWALAGGEDYELLLSVPPSRSAGFVRACARAGERVTQIGRLARGRRLEFCLPGGERAGGVPGFDHFTSDI